MMEERLRKAVLKFRGLTKYAKSLDPEDNVWLGRLSNNALAMALVGMANGKTTEETIQFLDRSKDSLKTYIRTHTRRQRKKVPAR